MGVLLGVGDGEDQLGRLAGLEAAGVETTGCDLGLLDAGLVVGVDVLHGGGPRRSHFLVSFALGTIIASASSRSNRRASRVSHHLSG